MHEIYQNGYPFGCNIVLDKIPVHARIPVIEEGNIRAKKAVREDYERLRPPERLHVQKRGWTLDVLQVVQSLGAGRAEATPLHKTFSLSDVYARARSLARLHPGNQNWKIENGKSKMEIRNAKIEIREQLQVLRDLGLVHFLGGGC